MNTMTPRKYSSAPPVSFSIHGSDPKLPPLIEPTCSPRGINPLEFEPHLHLVEQMLHKILSADLINSLTNNESEEKARNGIAKLLKQVPLLNWNIPEKSPCTLRVDLLCPSEYSDGAGRYLCDCLTRWLVPGKFLSIVAMRSLNFRFIACREKVFFFQQIYIDINQDKELEIVQNNWDLLKKEICLTILSVRHARHVVTTKALTPEQKKMVIEENLSAIIDRLPSSLSDNLFAHMHRYLLQVNAEVRIKQIQEQMAAYHNCRPKTFDREIFYELKNYIFLFNEEFTAIRDLRHVSRLIATLYLFRKTLCQATALSPDQRHFSLKFLSCTLSRPYSCEKNQSVLGIAGAVNVIRENELFEQRHILEAIGHCLPDVRLVKDSLILDRRGHDPVRLFYFEIEKKDGTPFTLAEMRTLKKVLPRELKESVESVLHPILMPRNEEEIMRNILLLSHQLKFVDDLPQLVISFNGQTEDELIFTVILVRVLRNDQRPLFEIFESSKTELKFKDLEIKKVGMLRKRYPKEANIFNAIVSKKRFLRKDFSVDLFKARQALSNEIDQILSGIRDYNGGILSKQQEAYQELHGLIDEKTANKDFLLENFFYSITPPLRQSLIPASTLKNLFSLLQEAIESDYTQQPFTLNVEFQEDQLLVMAGLSQSEIQTKLSQLIADLKIPSSELCHSTVNAYGITCVGYLYQNPDLQNRTHFHATLLKHLQEWHNL